MIEVKDNWYEEFFQGLNCELWEKAVSHEFTKEEVNFLIDELNVQPGQHILDIPCGFGRHAIEFAQRGYKVTGIDISMTFIDNLTAKVKAEKLTITPIKTDILKMQLSEQFSGAICMGNSFGYFNFSKMQIFIEKVASCLAKGAKFIINSSIVAESILPNFSKNKSFTVDGIVMDITNVYNVEDSYMTSHIIYTKEKIQEEHSFKQYVFTLGEIKRLLKINSLSTIAAYSLFPNQNSI